MPRNPESYADTITTIIEALEKGRQIVQPNEPAHANIFSTITAANGQQYQVETTITHIPLKGKEMEETSP